MYDIAHLLQQRSWPPVIASESILNATLRASGLTTKRTTILQLLSTVDRLKIRCQMHSPSLLLTQIDPASIKAAMPA